ncbi:MAG: hypothetical protein GXP19_09185 [Gammaproteobacteria bacterium]|nr:hypothetical protein [Gammaproteobacteria bacterium]
MCGNESYVTGIGFTSGVADEKWGDNDNSFSSRINFDVTNYGFVIDSSVAKNKLFNYQFFTDESRRRIQYNKI